jgi:hypothetical protein
MYIYRKNYKEVAYTIKETGKIKIFRDSRLQTWRASSADEVWKQPVREALLLRDAGLFVIVKPSTDWMMPTHIM